MSGYLILGALIIWLKEILFSPTCIKLLSEKSMLLMSSLTTLLVMVMFLVDMVKLLTSIVSRT
jgi:hypothetical protein